MRYPDAEMTMRGEVKFVDEYTNLNVLNGNALAEQKDIPLADTTGFTTTGKGSRIILGRGTPREERATVASISASTKIVATNNLTFNHTLDADTAVSGKSEDKPADGASEFLTGGSWTAVDWTSDSGYIHDVGTVEEVELIDAGEDYQPDDVIKVVDGANETCKIKVLTVDTGGEILTFEINAKGKNYTIKEELTTKEGNGSGATFNITKVNNTTPLSYSKGAVTGTRYQTTVTIANRTDGYVEVKFGGVVLGKIYATATFKEYAINTGGLIITPSPTFDGKVTVSIKEVSKVLLVTATTGFAVGETVVVNEGVDDEVSYTIASIQSGTSLTMVENLKRTHEATETVNQYGIGGTVEVCWKEATEPIMKPHHRNILFFIPASWTTAKITFLVSDTADGVYTPMEFIIPVWDSEEDVIVTDTIQLITDEINTGSDEYAFSWGGALRDVLAGMPYIKLLSGEVGSEVDQGATDVVVRYIMTR